MVLINESPKFPRLKWKIFVWLLSDNRRQSPLVVGTYVTLGWASPRANLANVNNEGTECLIVWFSSNSRDIVTLPFLLPVRLRSLRLIMDPHLPPQIVSTNASFLQIFDDGFPSFLINNGAEVREEPSFTEENFTFQLERAPFLWLALVLSLDLMTMTPLSVGLSYNTNLSPHLTSPYHDLPDLYGVGLQVLLAGPGRYGRLNWHDHFSPLELGKYENL